MEMNYGNTPAGASNQNQLQVNHPPARFRINDTLQSDKSKRSGELVQSSKHAAPFQKLICRAASGIRNRILRRDTLEYQSFRKRRLRMAGMSEVFLSSFMRTVREVTRAERCLAVDQAFSVCDRHNVPDDILESSAFSELVIAVVTDALQHGEAIITNNLIRESSEMPNTNIHLTDLRMVVVIPVGKLGAIYIDQHIRHGVFQREVIEKLAHLAEQIIAGNQLELTPEQQLALYEAL
jgi:hypothetical protein